MALRQVAKLLGWFFFLIGVCGFIPAFRSMPMDLESTLSLRSASGDLFGLLPTNALRNVMWIAMGLWGFSAMGATRSSVTFCRVISVISFVLAVMGVMPGLSHLFGLMPLGGGNVVLSVLVALLCAYFGFVYVHRPRVQELLGTQSEGARVELSPLHEGGSRRA